jgi:group I intron endonuclease
MKKTCGIYLITITKPNGRLLFYVGQSSNIKARIQQHRYALKAGRHCNAKLQRAFDKYGVVSFSSEVIDECTESELNNAEDWWLHEMVGYESVMNIGAQSEAPMRGVKFCEDHKRKISESISGSKHYNFGKQLSENHRNNISAGGKGVARRKETRVKISKATSGEKNPMHGMTGAKNKKSKPIIGLSIDDGYCVRFESAQLATKEGFQQPQITKCCTGEIRAHAGFLWAYAKDGVDFLISKRNDGRYRKTPKNIRVSETLRLLPDQLRHRE